MVRSRSGVCWLIALMNVVSSPVMGFGAGGVHGATIAMDDSLILLDATNQAIVRIR